MAGLLHGLTIGYVRKMSKNCEIIMMMMLGFALHGYNLVDV